MRKNELLLLPKLLVTPNMVKLVRKDVGKRKIDVWSFGRSEPYTLYEYYTYFRAIEKDGILKVALFKRKSIARGQKEPELEIYMDKAKEKYLTYFPLENRWSVSRLENLRLDMEKGEYSRNKTYPVGDAKKVVNNYFNENNGEIDNIIRNWQYGIAQDKLQKKYKRETNKIDEVMNCVPEIPKNFDKWALDKGFYWEKYLFYDKANRRAYCTACNSEIVIDKKAKYKHGHLEKCPKCKHPVECKAWNKQKNIRTEVYLGLFQKLTDGSGYVLRKFRAYEKRSREVGWDKADAYSWEEIRITFDNNLNEIGFYEYGWYKPYQMDRWTTGVNHGMGYYYYYGYSKASVRIYPGNLNQTLKDSCIKYIPIKGLVESNPGEYIKFERVIEQLKYNPQYEYIIKLGLRKFAFSLIKGDQNYKFNKEEKKMWNFLGITQEQLNYAIKHNSASQYVLACKRGKDIGILFTPQQAKFISEHNVPAYLFSKMNYTTPHKMLRYLDEKLDIKNRKNAAGDYYDYLVNCEKLGLPMDESTLFPQNFDRADQLCNETIAELEDEEKQANAEMQAIAFKKSQEEKKKLYEYEDKDFILLLPTSKKEFADEGRKMHNCVAGYYDRVRKGETTVLFLRRKEDPSKEYCTVEVKGNKLVQCRSAYNQDAPAEAKAFMDKFIRTLTKRLTSKKYVNNHKKAVEKLLEQLQSA